MHSSKMSIDPRRTLTFPHRFNREHSALRVQDGRCRVTVVGTLSDLPNRFARWRKYVARFPAYYQFSSTAVKTQRQRARDNSAVVDKGPWSPNIGAALMGDYVVCLSMGKDDACELGRLETCETVHQAYGSVGFGTPSHLECNLIGQDGEDRSVLLRQKVLSIDELKDSKPARLIAMLPYDGKRHVNVELDLEAVFKDVLDCFTALLWWQYRSTHTTSTGRVEDCVHRIHHILHCERGKMRLQEPSMCLATALFEGFSVFRCPASNTVYVKIDHSGECR